MSMTFKDGWACIYGLFLESNHLSILFRPSTTVKYNHSIVILQEQTIEWPFEDVNSHWLKREPHIHPCTDWYIKSFNQKKDRPGQKWHSPLLMKILTRSWILITNRKRKDHTNIYNNHNNWVFGDHLFIIIFIIKLGEKNAIAEFQLLQRVITFFSPIKLVQLIEHFHSAALKLKSIWCNWMGTAKSDFKLKISGNSSLLLAIHRTELSTLCSFHSPEDWKRGSWQYNWFGRLVCLFVCQNHSHPPTSVPTKSPTCHLSDKWEWEISVDQFDLIAISGIRVHKSNRIP